MLKFQSATKFLKLGRFPRKMTAWQSQPSCVFVNARNLYDAQLCHLNLSTCACCVYRRNFKRTAPTPHSNLSLQVLYLGHCAQWGNLEAGTKESLVGKSVTNATFQCVAFYTELPQVYCVTVPRGLYQHTCTFNSNWLKSCLSMNYDRKAYINKMQFPL